MPLKLSSAATATDDDEDASSSSIVISMEPAVAKDLSKEESICDLVVLILLLKVEEPSEDRLDPEEPRRLLLPFFFFFFFFLGVVVGSSSSMEEEGDTAAEGAEGIIVIIGDRLPIATSPSPLLLPQTEANALSSEADRFLCCGVVVVVEAEAEAEESVLGFDCKLGSILLLLRCFDFGLFCFLDLEGERFDFLFVDDGDLAEDDRDDFGVSTKDDVFFNTGFGVLVILTLLDRFEPTGDVISP
mmetsp:Transcript_8545/g.20583  ORF Transcript_8545/g.20583 Transcript_8545/m.20583 type:complete len:244 (+) Transcript_8545:44-775(+)